MPPSLRGLYKVPEVSAVMICDYDIIKTCRSQKIMGYSRIFKSVAGLPPEAIGCTIGAV